MKKPVIVWISVAALLIQSGWALAVQPRSARVFTDNQPDKFGTIGIVSARYAPTFKLRTTAGETGYSAGKGTKRALGGFWKGCGSVANASAGTDGGFLGLMAIFGCAAVTPFVAAGGAAFGATKGKRARGEGVKQAKLAMKPVLTERGIQIVLQDHVIRQTRTRTNYKLIPRWDIGPAKSEQPVNYQALAGQGIDTVLEVGVTKVRATGEGIHPSLSLTVVAHVRLIRVSDNVELYSHKHAFYSEPRELEEWVAGDPALRKISEQACADLAQEIVGSVFHLAPPTEATPKTITDQSAYSAAWKAD
ncbi:MAG: hypothetical protein ACE5K1_10645 [Acidiferrobacterales bacterium]